MASPIKTSQPPTNIITKSPQFTWPFDAQHVSSEVEMREQVQAMIAASPDHRGEVWFVVTHQSPQVSRCAVQPMEKYTVCKFDLSKQALAVQQKEKGIRREFINITNALDDGEVVTCYTTNGEVANCCHLAGYLVQKTTDGSWRVTTDLDTGIGSNW
jgi:hypothetical protein